MDHDGCNTGWADSWRVVVKSTVQNDCECGLVTGCQQILSMCPLAEECCQVQIRSWKFHSSIFVQISTTNWGKKLLFPIVIISLKHMWNKKQLIYQKISYLFTFRIQSVTNLMQCVLLKMTSCIAKDDDSIKVFCLKNLHSKVHILLLLKQNVLYKNQFEFFKIVLYSLYYSRRAVVNIITRLKWQNLLLNTVKTAFVKYTCRNFEVSTIYL